MSRNILVIAAHADDEALGCAGTLLKHIAQGDQVHLVFLTDGVSGRNIKGVLKSKRVSSSSIAAELMGASSVSQFDFPDNAMDSVPLIQIVRVIENKIRETQAEIVYSHFHSDLNIDHAICSRAVLTACRPQPNNAVQSILSFEVLSSTEWIDPSAWTFAPNTFVDITDHMPMKQKILEAYHSEMRQSPHSRSIEGVRNLAGYRGHSIGCLYAEAFMLVRNIIR